MKSSGYLFLSQKVQDHNEIEDRVDRISFPEPFWSGHIWESERNGKLGPPGSLQSASKECLDVCSNSWLSHVVTSLRQSIVACEEINSALDQTGREESWWGLMHRCTRIFLYRSDILHNLIYQYLIYPKHINYPILPNNNHPSSRFLPGRNISIAAEAVLLG